ncbi:MAG: hypothetical protein HYS18_04125 [Burkholderiales bacterium]|nr:hypothetical protein [Burkholderiales bacterium]
MTYFTARNKFSASLMAKGSCWYCNKHLDDVRRFCGRECAEAFEEDEMAMERRMQATRQTITDATYASA